MEVENDVQKGLKRYFLFQAFISQLKLQGCSGKMQDITHQKNRGTSMLQLYSYVQAGESIMRILPATHQSHLPGQYMVCHSFPSGQAVCGPISMLISFLHRSTQQEDQHCCYHTHHPQSQHRKTMYNMGVMLTRPSICNQNQSHA